MEANLCCWLNKIDGSYYNNFEKNTFALFVFLSLSTSFPSSISLPLTGRIKQIWMEKWGEQENWFAHQEETNIHYYCIALISLWSSSANLLENHFSEWVAAGQSQSACIHIANSEIHMYLYKYKFHMIVANKNLNLFPKANKVKVCVNSIGMNDMIILRWFPAIFRPHNERNEF